MRAGTGIGHAEGLTGGDDTAGAHDTRDEWQRYAAGWHAAFAGLVALTGGLVWLEDGIGTGVRLAALGLVLVVAGWYAVAGTRGIQREPGWPGPAYLAVAAPLTVALDALVPVGALLLFALFPHIWVMLPPRRAIVVTCATAPAVGVATLAHARIDNASIAIVILLSLVSITLSLALGLWINRIITQSRRRAELVAQLAATRAELAEVSRAAGALAERERLAHDIHDTLAQGFTSVLLLLEAARAALSTDPEAAARHLDRARDTARENLAEARALIGALTPPDLVRTSLPEALRRLVDRVGAEGPRTELVVTGTPRGLPTEHEVALLRMAQESLANVRRHAGAGRVEVSLAYEPDRVSLRVHDDGCGFDPDAPRTGYGLAGILARAQRIGGAATVDTAVGAGVLVRVEVPVSP
jgi:signal transduction histidine kinase